jgi:hypothetical protein
MLINENKELFMFKIFSRILSTVVLILPLTVFANGHIPLPSPKVDCKQKPCEDYTGGVPPYSCHSYHSGLYLGIQGSYVFVTDFAEFQGNNPSDPFYLPMTWINHLNSYGGGAYIGFGQVLDRGFLPYLGAELGLNLRANYNDDNGSFSEGNIYGKQINSRGGISFDVTPGFFMDDTNTTLMYLRIGVEGDQFRIKSDLNDIKNSYEYRPLARVGAGFEHEIVNNFYLRADYVFSIMVDSVDYEPYLPTYNDMYASRVVFNTASLGITYRF